MKVYKIRVFNHLSLNDYDDSEETFELVERLKLAFGTNNIELVEIKKGE